MVWVADASECSASTIAAQRTRSLIASAAKSPRSTSAWMASWRLSGWALRTVAARCRAERAMDDIVTGVELRQQPGGSSVGLAEPVAERRGDPSPATRGCWAA